MGKKIDLVQALINQGFDEESKIIGERLAEEIRKQLKLGNTIVVPDTCELKTRVTKGRSVVDNINNKRYSIGSMRKLKVVCHDQFLGHLNSL